MGRRHGAAVTEGFSKSPSVSFADISLFRGSKKGGIL